MRVIFEQGNYRIVEQQDDYLSVRDFDFDPRDELIAEKHGVFTFTLERWNPAVGIGWEHVDSCGGFIGQYNNSQEYFNHYIVEEMKQTISEGK